MHDDDLMTVLVFGSQVSHVIEPQLEHRNALGQRVAHFPKQKRTVRENQNQRVAGGRNQKLNRVQTELKHLTEVDKTKEIKKIHSVYQNFPK